MRRSLTFRRSRRQTVTRRATAALTATGVATLVATVALVAQPAPIAADDAHFIEYTTSATAPRGSVTFIGDSVGIGAGRFAPRLSDHLERLGWGPIRFHAVDGKRTGHPPGWPDYFNAAPLIDQWQDSGWDSDTWIINLGANDSGYCSRDVACARASIMLVVDAIGPGHRIWWPKITRLYTHQHQADAWNLALDQIAAERTDFFTWDWPSEMRAHPDVYGSWDNTHLYPDGYRRRSDIMAQVFTEALGRAQRIGGDAPLPPVAGDPSEVVLADPVRLVDTRDGARLAAGEVLAVDVSRHAPRGATAVALNLTAVRPAADGFLTAFPCDQPQPDTSSLNHTTRTRAAPAVVPLAADATVCVATESATDIIVDLQAVFVPAGTDPTATRLTPIVIPQRLVDTRETGRRSVVTVRVPGRGTAAAVNLTVARAGDHGFITAGPCANAPTSDTDPSNVNFEPGQTIAAAAFVPIGSDGTFCVTTSVPVDVIVDVTGMLDPSGELAFVAARPARLIDTRDGTGGWSPVHGAGDIIDLRAAPAGSRAVTGTLTLVRPWSRSFLTAAPCGTGAGTSSVNGAADDVLANTVSVAVDADQRLCLTASTTGHTLFDVTGWWVTDDVP